MKTYAALLLTCLLTAFLAGCSEPTEAEIRAKNMKKFEKRFPEPEDRALAFIHYVTAGQLQESPYKLLAEEPGMFFLFGSHELGPLEVRFEKGDVDYYDLIARERYLKEVPQKASIEGVAEIQVFDAKDPDWPDARVLYDGQPYLIHIKPTMRELAWSMFSRDIGPDTPMEEYMKLYEKHKDGLMKKPEKTSDWANQNTFMYE